MLQCMSPPHLPKPRLLSLTGLACPQAAVPVHTQTSLSMLCAHRFAQLGSGCHKPPCPITKTSRLYSAWCPNTQLDKWLITSPGGRAVGFNPVVADTCQLHHMRKPHESVRVVTGTSLLEVPAGHWQACLVAPVPRGGEWRCSECRCKPQGWDLERTELPPPLQIHPASAQFITHMSHQLITMKCFLCLTSPAWLAVTAEVPEVHPRKGIKPVPSGTKTLRNMPSPYHSHYRSNAQHRSLRGSWPSHTLQLPTAALSHHRKVHPDAVFTYNVSTLASVDGVNILTFKPKEFKEILSASALPSS